MSLGIFKIDSEHLHYTGPLRDRELSFLKELRCKDGTYFIEEVDLSGWIEDYKEMGGEIPEELVKFLFEKLEKEDGAISIRIK